MIAANPNDFIRSTRSKPVPPTKWLGERVRRYFDQHPEVSREEFWLEALRREIHFREQRDAGIAVGPECRGRERGARWSTPRSPVTAEDIRIHAWLTERLALLHYERHGLWPRLRRVLFGNRLVRWLRSLHRSTSLKR